MSEFCNNCPMRGQAVGDIKSVYTTDTDINYEVSAVMGHGARLEAFSGRLSALVAENGGVSSPFKTPRGAASVFERSKQRVDACTEPYVEDRGIFKPRLIITGCPALGEFAVHSAVNMQFQNMFQQVVNLDSF